MDILDQKTDEELIRSILAEIAKASNELRCATSDLKKANSRLSFLLVVANKLIERQGD
jgi:flagellar hook-basal body complex protein FliE